MISEQNNGPTQPTLTLEERIQRKQKRNRLLLLLSPVLVLLSPVLLPVFLVIRRRKLKKKRDRAKKNPIIRLGHLSGGLQTVPVPEVDKAEEARIANMSDTFALCRVIGNDLVPRHRAGQSLENVKFILENEPEFEDCKKLWILNRIFDPQNERNLIALLEKHGQTYTRIPFEAEDLQVIGFDFENFDDVMVFADGRLQSMPEEVQARMISQVYRGRNNYVMHNNGARNAALEYCLQHGKWALPFDGNCYFTKGAWQSLKEGILSQRDKRYIVVPMARMLDNAELLKDDITPNATEEPQLAFRCDAPLRFDEAHPYGKRPKVELFLHLGIPGPWDEWAIADYDSPPRKTSPEGHRVGRAGWVARLFSGQARLETDDKDSIKNRGVARNTAIRATLDMLEGRAVSDVLSSGRPIFYSDDQLNALVGKTDEPAFAAVVKCADEALTRGPYSVTDKPEPGPSGDLHDYFHPVPYWWPNPKKKNGLPYVFQDGKRVPGTNLYDEQSDQYDRTRLQRLFDDTTSLAMAARISGDARYAKHAEFLVRTWFITPDTRMNPNLTYAQVRRGHRNDKGLPQGLIETKDLYFFLDALRVLGNPELISGVKEWCAEFFEWLKTAEQGLEESRAENNHGTCFDLQSAALAAFLGDVEHLQEINLRAQARLTGSITQEGEQPHEMMRTMTQHYCTFNVQSWINLFNLLEGAGLRPWSSSAATRLTAAIRKVLIESDKGWEHQQISPFDMTRLAPLEIELRRRTGQGEIEVEAAPDCYFPHDGIAPFWRFSGGAGSA